jgi:Flp pilus assembly protein CpaB
MSKLVLPIAIALDTRNCWCQMLAGNCEISRQSQDNLNNLKNLLLASATRHSGQGLQRRSQRVDLWRDRKVKMQAIESTRAKALHDELAPLVWFVSNRLLYRFPLWG